jgi:hypothetical protein
MMSESVFGVLRIGVEHQTIARDLGHNACGGNGGIHGIALNNQLHFRFLNRWALIAVYADPTGFEPFSHPGHGLQSGLENVDPINLFGIHDLDRNFGFAENANVGSFPAARAEGLAIGDAPRIEVLGQDDPGDNQRAREGATTGFIDTSRSRKER